MLDINLIVIGGLYMTSGVFFSLGMLFMDILHYVMTGM